jgi:hypothetical protein
MLRQRCTSSEWSCNCMTNSRVNLKPFSRRHALIKFLMGFELLIRPNVSSLASTNLPQIKDPPQSAKERTLLQTKGFADQPRSGLRIRGASEFDRRWISTSEHVHQSPSRCQPWPNLVASWKSGSNVGERSQQSRHEIARFSLKSTSVHSLVA